MSQTTQSNTAVTTSFPEALSSKWRDAATKLLKELRRNGSPSDLESGEEKLTSDIHDRFEIFSEHGSKIIHHQSAWTPFLSRPPSLNREQLSSVLSNFARMYKEHGDLYRKCGEIEKAAKTSRSKAGRDLWRRIQKAKSGPIQNESDADEFWVSRDDPLWQQETVGQYAYNVYRASHDQMTAEEPLESLSPESFGWEITEKRERERLNSSIGLPQGDSKLSLKPIDIPRIELKKEQGWAGSIQSAIGSYFRKQR